MIAFLAGTLRSKSIDHGVILVNGVGYKVFLSARHLEALPDIGEEVALEIATVVREDDIVLYGFLDPFEQRFFSALIGISGIGPKSAMAILGQASWVDLFAAVKKEDVGYIRGLKGVGEKTARLMLLGLKNKLSEFESAWHDRRRAGSSGQMSQEIAPPAEGIVRDVENALFNLGYSRVDIRKVLARMEITPESPLQAVIKQSLQMLSGQMMAD